MPPEARFVDVTYRGLKVALRAKLTETSATSGFVEVEAPLPVGTRLQVADGGAMLEVRVVGVVEQESGAKSAPGMRISWGEAVAVVAPAPPPPVTSEAPAPVIVDPAPEASAGITAEVVEPEPETPEPEPEPEVTGPEAAPAVAAAGNGDVPVEGRRRRRTRKTQIGRP